MDCADYFRRTVHDITLYKLLLAVLREEYKLEPCKLLQHYVLDPKNLHTVSKCGQGLWEALLQLNSLHGYEFVKLIILSE